MDQGVAAVWASGVAAFASAAGAVAGAQLSGHAARGQVVQQAMLDRARRQEERRREAYSTFRCKIAAAISAVSNLERAVREKRPDDEEDLAVSTALHEALASVFEIKACGPAHMADLAAQVCELAAKAAHAARKLRADPEAISDRESPGNQFWSNAWGDMTTALGAFAGSEEEAVTEAELRLV